jgi:hypothetical protein
MLGNWLKITIYALTKYRNAASGQVAGAGGRHGEKVGRIPSIVVKDGLEAPALHYDCLI